LRNGQEYEYTVSTVNNYGESVHCPVVSVTPLFRAVVPAAPTFDRIANVKCDYFEYWWHNQFDNARLYTQVEYYYDLNIAGTSKRVSGAPLFARGSVMDAFKHLENDVEVFFRFRDGNAGETNASNWSAWSSGRSSIGTAPGVPQNFTLTRVSPTMVQLTFNPASTGYQTHGFQLFHKNAPIDNPYDPEPFDKVQEVDGTVTSINFAASEGQIDSFTIRAFNDNSTCGRSYSGYSPKIYVYNGYYPVNPPFPLKAACVSPNEIDLTWPDNSAGEDGFRIERRENPGIWQFIDNAPANATVYQDNLVTPDKKYEYRVRATCPAGAEWWPGYSEWATATASTKSLENIPKISFLFTMSPSPTQIVVNWYLNTDRGWENVTAYTLQQSSDHGSTPPGDGTYSTITTQPGNVSSFSVTGLTPGVNYWFRVSATTWAGTSAFEEQTEPAQTIPASPTNLTATAISGSQVNLSWTDNSSNEERFGIQYSQQDPPNWNNPINTSIDNENVTTCTFNDLQPNVKYWFRVNTINYWGSSAYSNVVSVTTPTDACYNTRSNGNGLNGYVIGTAPSSAGNEYCKASDGNINTFFGYGQANGAYTGLRFDQTRNIRKIRYYPRSGYASRMVGGKFQGSNAFNFSVSEDLYTISSTPAAGWNEVTISSPSPFEFVRYLAPNGSYGNIAEMEFYETPTTYSIEATAEASLISPSGSISVASHTDQTFTFAPDPLLPLRKLGDVLVDGSSVGAVSSYTFRNVTGPHSIMAKFAPQTKYEAENASLSGTAKINTNHTGFSGTGFVDGFWNSTTAKASFTVYTGAIGNYSVKLRYSAGNGTSSNTGFYVNGVKIKNLTCPSTGNWNTWANVSEIVELQGGFNTIEYKSESSGSYPINLDFIELTDMSPHTIYAVAMSNGSITPSGDVEVPNGGSQTFTITPDPYYQIDEVLIDNVDQGNISSYTFNNVIQGGHAIVATFEPMTKYEAENAILSGSASPNTNHTGFSGTGFVEGFWNSSDAMVLFNVNSNGGGSYALKLRYSAGNGTSTNVGLYVDGVKIKNLTCPGTGNWNTWADISEIVQLTYDDDGVHQIWYKAETSSGNPINLDYLSFDYMGQFVYEAEYGSYGGTAHVNSNHSGYSGTGFVDGFFESTTAVSSFYVNVVFGGTYEVKLRYSAGNGTSTNMGLYVDGVKIKNITCPGTASWDTWAEMTETVTLSAYAYPVGSGHIEYKAETSSGNCINLDKITLKPISLLTPANLKVYMLDQIPGSNQQTQPRFYIQNEGTTPLSNFTMKYYFTVENGQTPVIDNYYMAPYCNAVITQVSGNNYCVVITFSGTLPAGGRIPGSDGLNFALHYVNFPQLWNQSNDFSQPAGSSYMLTNKVAIFNSSNQLIYGSQP
jgi:hypothetical protein